MRWSEKDYPAQFWPLMKTATENPLGAALPLAPRGRNPPQAWAGNEDMTPRVLPFLPKLPERGTHPM